MKKGEKGHIVVFWTWLNKEDDKTGKLTKIPFLRYYTVFEISKQKAADYILGVTFADATE